MLVAGVGAGGYWGVSTVRASFPQTTGEIRLDSLSGQVEVKRDAMGVPQIYADNETDLFRAQGYVQAQDRFYEMDVRRHVTAGRLSEMFGEGQVETDSSCAPSAGAGSRRRSTTRSCRRRPRSTSRRTRRA